jgi:hypothetical protein
MYNTICKLISVTLWILAIGFSIIHPENPMRMIPLEFLSLCFGGWLIGGYICEIIFKE